MKTKLLILLATTLLVGSSVAQNTHNRPVHNPLDPRVHDPAMAKQGDTYYLFSTGFGVNVMSSKDMTAWNIEKPIFTTPPQWAEKAVDGFKGHIWAPDIIHHNGLYHLFYSCSAFAKNTSVIGHATNPTLDITDPKFCWTDHGKLLQSIPYRDMWNAIDPNVIVDKNGTPWMNFGSFWDGIKMVRLTDDMMNIAEPQEWYSLCRRERTHNLDDNNPGDGAVEAPFVFHHNGYYYLFVSFDYCCRGVKSDYKIVVGRSESVTGPYLDKQGVSMSIGGGTVLMRGNDEWAGVGHCSVYTFDDGDYLATHAYSTADNGASKLIIRKIFWDNDNWPLVEFLKNS